MKTATELNEDAREWLQRFARCVRERTYEEACPLFDESVFSFGTVADQVRGLEDLMAQQWREVWDVTQGFDFEYSGARCWNAGALMGIAAPWSSQGRTEDGATFDRLGRATLLLRRSGERWKAVHTHFSMNPDP